MNGPKVVINEGKCISCGECVADCPGRVLAARDDGKAIYARPERCILCGHCAAICPVGAISIPVYDTNNFPPVEHADISYERMLAFLRKRRSVRRYADKPIPKDIIEQLLEAARYAPTGNNAQACKYTIVYGVEAVRRVSDVMIDYYEGLAKMMSTPWGRGTVRMMVGKKAYARLKHYLPWVREMIEMYKAGDDPIFFHAPLLIGINGDSGSYTAYDDCVIAGYHMVMAAETLGLGSCLNGVLTGSARHSADIRQAMAVPDGQRLFAAVTFGYPAVKYQRVPDRFPSKTKWLER